MSARSGAQGVIIHIARNELHVDMCLLFLQFLRFRDSHIELSRLLFTLQIPWAEPGHVRDVYPAI